MITGQESQYSAAASFFHDIKSDELCKDRYVKYSYYLTSRSNFNSYQSNLIARSKILSRSWDALPFSFHGQMRRDFQSLE